MPSSGVGPAQPGDNEAVVCTAGHEEQVIAILLAEYLSIRDEMAARSASRLQLLGFVAVGLGFIVAAKGPDWWDLVVAMGLVVLTVAAWARGSRIIHEAGAYLGMLEQRINQIAERAHGCPSVLDWESTLQVGRRQRPIVRTWIARSPVMRGK
jgi:hypothetical protein